MQFALLGSGSRGNATLIRAGNTTLLIDCGFSVREACARLEALGVAPQSIDALLVTHEHGDHLRGVAPLHRRFGLPVWASRGTAQPLLADGVAVNIVNVHQGFRIDDVQVHPVPVPHDAREPCQYILDDGEYRLGLLTDVGQVTPHIVKSYRECDALMLEFNHDADMLAGSHYPPSVKARVAGRLGHLGNHQSAALLAELLPGRLRCLVAAHLSESNNTPQQVQQQAAAILNGHRCHFDVAAQDAVSPWYRLDQLC